MNLPRFLLRLCLRKPVPELSQDNAAYFAMRYAQCAKFFARFGVPIDFRGKTVLDYGSGLGNTSWYMAVHGAGFIYGIEPDDAWRNWANDKFAANADLYLPVVFGKDTYIGDDFDLIISEDCMEHYDNPAAILAQWKTLLAPGGRVLVGFSPLWKSPSGGHIGYMTWLPWAHLLFREADIMAERRRYRPDENAACFSEMRGGLNKMTLGRFKSLVTDSGFEFESLRVNVSESRVMRAVGLLATVPIVGEYFCKNCYAVLRLKTP